MASTTRRLPKKAVTHREFPRSIARFSGLEGGQFGTIELLAISHTILELQLGDDFVRFSQAQAREMRDAFDRFIALHHRHPATIVEEVVEVVERAPRRSQSTRGRRARAPVVEEVVAEVVEQVGRKRSLAANGRRVRSRTTTA